MIAAANHTRNDLKPSRRGSTGGTVALYVRLTREESLKGLSAEAQIENGTAYAKKSMLDTPVVYQEMKAVGGDVPFENREAGRRLIADIKAGRVRHVVVRDMDRLARDVRLWIDFQELCRERGVTIHTLSGELAIKSPTDKFSCHVRAAAAQLEKDQVGDRVRRVKRAMAQQGKHAGGPPPFGYTSQARRRAELIASKMPEEEAKRAAETEYPHSGVLHIDATESHIVKLIYDWYVRKLWGCRRIANELNALGHRRRTGLLWCSEKVRRIINDPAVAGLIAYDEIYFHEQMGKRTPKCRQELHPGKHPPIIDESLWRQAQSVKAKNTCHHLNHSGYTARGRRYLLSGLIRCSCGATVVAKSAAKGKSFGYYICTNRKYRGSKAEGGCTCRPLNTEKVEEAVLDQLGVMFSDKTLVDRVHEAAEQIAAEMDKRSVDTSSAGQREAKLVADLKIWYVRHDSASTDLERDAAWKRIVELSEQIKKIQAVLPSAPPTKVRVPTKAKIGQQLRGLVSLLRKDIEGGRRLVRSLAQHHGLSIQLQHNQTILVTLSFMPPGCEQTADLSFGVTITGEALLPKDKISAWVDEQQKSAPLCACGCGNQITVSRRHYWKGVPEFRRECRHKGMARRRSALANGLLTGQRVAELLGIGRTTVNRWVKSGKLPPARRSVSGMLLFSPEQIRQHHPRSMD